MNVFDKMREAMRQALYNGPDPGPEPVGAALTAALSALEAEGYKLVKFRKVERVPFVIEGDDEPLTLPSTENLQRGPVAEG